jgi:hypothetical protein
MTEGSKTFDSRGTTMSFSGYELFITANKRKKNV